jgi:SAM-dependent methyltransferase
MVQKGQATMFSETAELYDVIYGQFKDYSGESRQVAELLARFAPDARGVLDVACGSGEHARLLAENHGYKVDGIDLEPSFVEIAQRKSPQGRFTRADMLDFSLGLSYDVVLCLFSSIGYARTIPNVRRALASFLRHLEAGGILILEPWFTPAEWRTGMIHASTADGEGVKVSRMSHSIVRDGLSVLEFQYLIGGPEGIQHRREIHELGLFPTDELGRAIEETGFRILEHDPVGLIGRGLFVAEAIGRPMEGT